MRQLLLVKRLIFVTQSHVLPLPFLNLTSAQKDFTLLSFHSLSTLFSKSTSSHSLYTILCAISGYPRTIHSLQNQQNKATFIRVDLVPPPSLQPLSHKKQAEQYIPHPALSNKQSAKTSIPAKNHHIRDKASHSQRLKSRPPSRTPLSFIKHTPSHRTILL